MTRDEKATFADIVADAFGLASPFDTDDMAQRILADPRFADLLAGALHHDDAYCVWALDDAGTSVKLCSFADHRERATAIIRSLGEQS